MRIYHLEENLKKFQDGEHRQDAVTATAKAEVHDLKIKLEEMQIELEQRELLMVKASGVINTLKQELDRCKESLERQDELESKIRGLKHSNEDIAHEFRGQLISLEKELHETRQQLLLKEQERSQLEDRLKQSEVTVAHLQDRVSEGHADRARVEEKWHRSQEQASAWEEEVTQCRAHVDLFKIRLEEEHEEKERLKQQVRDIVQLKDAAEDRHRARMMELSHQHEEQLKTLRERHDGEIEKLRAGQVQMMADIRDNYQQEVAKKQAMMDKTLAELRTADANENHRVKEDCASRVEEKNEELRALRGVMATERARLEGMIAEVETIRVENREKAALIEHLRAELQAKGDELQLLSGLRRELQDAHRRAQELQDALRAETMEKMTLQVKHEAACKENDDGRRRYAETEAELSLTKQELAKLSYVSTELGSKSETAESLARDNERWKLVHQKLQSELVEATHRHFSLQKDHEYLTAEHQRATKQLDALQAEHRQLRDTHDRVAAQEKEHGRELLLLREAHARLETTLAEQRASFGPLSKRFEVLQRRVQRSKQALRAAQDEHLRFWERVVPILRMLQQAVGAWDHALAHLVDGGATPAAAATLTPAPRGGDAAFDPFEAPGAFLAASAGPSSPGLAFSLHTAAHHAHRGGHRQRRGAKRSAPKSSSLSAAAPYYDDGEDDDGAFGATPFSDSDSDAEEAAATLHAAVDDHARQLEDFRHAMAVAIERFHVKVQRTQRLRGVFAQRATQTLAQADALHLSAQEKVALLQQRVADAQQAMARLQHVFARDAARHAQELSELQALRDVLLQQHSAQLAALTARADALQSDKEQAALHADHQARQIDRLAAQLAAQEQQLAAYKADAAQLETFEDAVAALSARLEALVTERQLLQRDLRYVGDERARLETLCASQRDQLLALQAQHEAGEAQRALLEEKQRELVDLVARLERDNDQLRRRQIDPALALALLDSQQQLAVSAAGHGASGGHSGGGGAAIDRDTLLALDAHVSSLQQRAEQCAQRLERLFLSASVTVAQRWQEEGAALKHLLQGLAQEQQALCQRVLHLFTLVRHAPPAAAPPAAALPRPVAAAPWRPSLAASSSLAASRPLPPAASAMQLRELQPASPTEREELIYRAPQYDGDDEDAAGAAASAASDSDAAMLADIRRRVAEVSSGRRHAPSSSGAATSSSPTDDSAASPPSYERQQQRRRVSRLDKSLSLLARKLDAFDLAQTAR
eukprot:gene13034-9328_t